MQCVHLERRDRAPSTPRQPAPPERARSEIKEDRVVHHFAGTCEAMTEEKRASVMAGGVGLKKRESRDFCRESYIVVAGIARTDGTF
ncbi:hypothetical protein PXNS11_240001 [Stutzerimonas xanthomarina]|nr:hypothetical protein PXNS11_240001 [Stutzerimonas xanthomarina]